MDNVLKKASSVSKAIDVNKGKLTREQLAILKRAESEAAVWAAMPLLGDGWYDEAIALIDGINRVKSRNLDLKKSNKGNYEIRNEVITDFQINCLAEKIVKGVKEENYSIRDISKMIDLYIEKKR